MLQDKKLTAAMNIRLNTATVSNPNQQVKQFYDCHIQGNCDIRNLFFKKRYINIQYNKKQIQTFPIVNHK